MEYSIQRENTGYSVWTVGLSGSKQDCLGHVPTVASARKLICMDRAKRRYVDET